MSRPHIQIAEDTYIELWPDASRPHLTIIADMGLGRPTQQRVIVFRDEIESFREAFERAVELLHKAMEND